MAPTAPIAPRADAGPVAIEVEGLEKSFRIPTHRVDSFKERALHPLARTEYRELRALQGVSFEIHKGEFFGIVGRNGSGKSTLLKCLAGIYRPDQGEITVHGRLSPFIELGVGFNPDLTARDNVVINAVMMGLSRRDARSIFDKVIAFAELEEFVDLKLKNYSSGMAVRLGFATAIQVESEVLLVDEVLAVGDAAFQQKCFEEFTRLRTSGRTIVFVTHDMSAVERFCDRAMLIDRGKVLHIGGPHEISRAYNELNFGRLVHNVDEADRFGDQAAAEILDAWFEDAQGERIAQQPQGGQITAAVRIQFHEAIDEPVLGISLRNDVGHTVFVATSEWADVPTGHFSAGDALTFRVRFDSVLAPTQYKLTPSIAHAGSGANAIDLREDLATLQIHGIRVTGGLIDVPHSFEIESA